MKSLWELAIIFFRIGCFMFGGGSAMLPLLEEELVVRRQWLNREQLMDYYTIGQSTPGIIAVNVATFTGYTKAGIKGALVATLALVLAPMCVILCLANVLTYYMENPYVMRAFTGIRIVVIALIAEAVCRLWKAAVKNKTDILFFLIAFGLAVGGVSVIMIMLLFVAGNVLYFWQRGWK